MTAGPCPNCGCPLTLRPFFAVDVGVCPACAGLWFGSGQLERLREASCDTWKRIESEVFLRERTSDHGVRYCPHCREPLFRYQYMYRSGILLDECNRCGGIWVDDGELAKMSAFLDEARSEPEDASEPAGAVEDRLAEETEIKDRMADHVAALAQLDAQIRGRFQDPGDA